MSLKHEPSSNNTNIVRKPEEENSRIESADEKVEYFATPWSVTSFTGAELDETLRQEGNHLQKHRRKVHPGSKKLRERNHRIRLARAAKVPEVGIFFVVNGKLRVSGVPWTENPSYAGYRTYSMNHPDFWEFLYKTRQWPGDWRYEEVARGRVNYHEASGAFNLFSDRCILKKKRLVRAILAAFNLPRETNVVQSDQYQCVGCLPRRPPNLWLDTEWNS